jgi:hypothetical protein
MEISFSYAAAGQKFDGALSLKDQGLFHGIWEGPNHFVTVEGVPTLLIRSFYALSVVGVQAMVDRMSVLFCCGIWLSPRETNLGESEHSAHRTTPLRLDGSAALWLR